MKKRKKFICKLLVVLLILNSVPSNSIMAASKIKLNKSKITIKVGQSKKIKIVGANKKVRWKSSNKKIVKMSAVKNNSVKITAVREGKAKVSAKIGKKKFYCKIIVKKAEETKQDGTMDKPTVVPIVEPTVVSTIVPTAVPTVEPTVVPTIVPTVEPTVVPTIVPTAVPTIVPTVEPTVVPTIVPTAVPTIVPTVEPTVVPTIVPTAVPTVAPTVEPTAVPTVEPTVVPTTNPTETPSREQNNVNTITNYIKMYEDIYTDKETKDDLTYYSYITTVYRNQSSIPMFVHICDGKIVNTKYYVKIKMEYQYPITSVSYTMKIGSKYYSGYADINLTSYVCGDSLIFTGGQENKANSEFLEGIDDWNKLLNEKFQFSLKDIGFESYDLDVSLPPSVLYH